MSCRLTAEVAWEKRLHSSLAAALMQELGFGCTFNYRPIDRGQVVISCHKDRGCRTSLKDREPRMLRDNPVVNAVSSTREGTAAHRPNLPSLQRSHPSGQQDWRHPVATSRNHETNRYSLAIPAHRET